MRALVIDDSRAMRAIIGQTLRSVGIEIKEAGNGREGIVMLSEPDPVSLIVVDWNMPEMNGIDFVKAVRSQKHYNHIKIMMVTTETDITRMSEAMKHGADEYVMKPFTRDVLIQKLQQLGLLRETAAASA